MTRFSPSFGIPYAAQASPTAFWAAWRWLRWPLMPALAVWLGLEEVYARTLFTVRATAEDIEGGAHVLAALSVLINAIMLPVLLGISPLLGLARMPGLAVSAADRLARERLEREQERARERRARQ